MAIKMWATNSWFGGTFLRAVFSVAIVLPLLLAGTLATEEIRAAEEQEADPAPGANEKPDRPVESVQVAGPIQAEDRSERRAEMRKKILKKFDADGDGKLNDEERTKLREKMRQRHGERGPRAWDGRGDRDHGKKAHGKKRHGKRGPDQRRGHGDWGHRDRGSDGPGGREIFGNQTEGKRSGPRERGDFRERGGARGHGGPPDLDKLFQKFDTNEDEQLDREEFKAALHAMRKMHERRQGQYGKARPGSRGSRDGQGSFRPGPPRGPRPDRNGRPGPPPEFGPRPGLDESE